MNSLTIIQMDIFSNPVLFNVLIGVILISVSTAAVGCLLYVQKNALLGETLAHGCLPAIYFAFIFSETRNLFWLSIGAAISGLISSYLVDFIVAKSRLSRDGAMAVVLSSMFGLGIMLLSFIQQNNYPNQNGLEDLFFGNAAAMSGHDIRIIGLISIAIWFLLITNYRKLLLTLFDPGFAKFQGIRPKVYIALISTLAATSVAIGMQTTGAVLIAALIITPAASARIWCSRLFDMIFLAIVLAIIGGTAGTLCSYAAPKMPTGPWVVVCMAVLFLLSSLTKRIYLYSTKSD